VEARAREWWRALQGLKGKTRPAVDTYAGDHWSVVRSLPTVAAEQGWKASLWVLSAGYGLVHAETPVSGYSATFAYGHDDSVGKDSGELGAWWAVLAQKALDGCSEPRSLTALLKHDPSAVFLIVASPNYLKAVEADLLLGIKATSHTARVVIVSSTRGLSATELAPWLVPSGSELQHAVHGARASLHARVARLIISEAMVHNFDLARVQMLCESRAQPGSGQMPVRAKQTNDEVQGFIRRALRDDASISYTALLRKLRSSGLACEMRRFRGLYTQERESAAHGS
jgi:hypothetical protein